MNATSTSEPAERILVTSEEDAITRVVEAFERSDWSEIDVRFGHLRVHLSAQTDGSAPTRTPNRAADTAPERTPPTDAGTAPVTSPVPLDLPPGAVTVDAPSPGIFWCAPEPGAPPFTEVGQRVAESSTVGIVEVMKLMNHVKARVSGEVVAVFVDNGVAVDKGQALVAVIPDAVGAEM